MPEYALISLYEMTFLEMSALFTEAFTGYIGGHVHMTPPALSTMVTRENVDLTASRILLDSDVLVGFGFIACQGWTSRLAAMGIIPAMQGQGAGRWLLDQLLTEARARGEKTMTLEAFEQNAPAVALYKRLGFSTVRRLYGASAESLPGHANPALVETDPADMGRQVMLNTSPDLPWQFSGPAMMRTGTPTKAFSCGHAWAAVADTGDTLVLRAVYVPPHFRRQGEARRLIHALAAAYPQHKWRVPAIWPEEYCGFLDSLGFTRQPLNQLHMSLSLTRADSPLKK